MISRVSLIDKTAFLEGIDRDSELLRRLIALYEEQSQEILVTMEHSLSRGDWGGVAARAHDVKNIGRMIFSPALIDSSAALEEIVARRAIDDAEEKINELRALLGTIRAELQEILKSCVSGGASLD